MSGRHYRILQTLGRGGFGVVYRCELIAAGGFTKEVAVKLIERAGDDEIAIRLRDEARILGLLQHRAIVGVDSLAHLADGWAVVMEYVPGVDLSQVAAADPPARVAVEIVEEVASALHAAWSTINRATGKPLQLIHRDIKPQNVRITPRGEVKVLDFGVARADFDAREAHTQSAAYGTLAYMSPERLERIETHAGDIYALGLVFLELLSGALTDLPPRNPSRFNPWIEARLAIARERLVGTPTAEVQKLLHGVRKMVDLEYEDRPDARTVEVLCRDVGPRIPGLRLRDWAEAQVPRIEATVPPAASPATGNVLVERSGAVSLVEAAATTGEVRRKGAAPDLILSTTEVAWAKPAKLGPWIAGGVVVVVGLLALIGLFGVLGAVGLASRGTETAAIAPVVAPAAPAAPPAEAPPPVPTVVAAPVAPTPAPAAPTVAAPPRAPGKAPAAPAAAPVAAPEPAAPVTGRVAVSGGARAVTLLRDGKRYGPGDLDPGSYTIEADFGGGPIQMSRVEVDAGSSRTVHCDSTLMNCVVR